MARIIEVDGKRFALLVEGPSGAYVVPPIVMDSAGTIIEGLEVLRAIADSGITAEVPVLRDQSVADLARIDQQLQAVCDQLGVGTLTAERGEI